jgi:hypothetical protein
MTLQNGVSAVPVLFFCAVEPAIKTKKKVNNSNKGVKEGTAEIVSTRISSGVVEFGSV